MSVHFGGNITSTLVRLAMGTLLLLTMGCGEFPDPESAAEAAPIGAESNALKGCTYVRQCETEDLRCIDTACRECGWGGVYPKLPYCALDHGGSVVGVHCCPKGGPLRRPESDEQRLQCVEDEC